MIVLLDIGGTSTRLALAPSKKVFETPILFDTHPIYTEGIAEIRRHADELLSERLVTEVVVGIAGTLAANKRSLSRSPHLPDWVGVDLVSKFEEVFSTTAVTLINDASLGGLGEAIHGAGKGASIVAYITVGTGIGGSRITNGEIDESASGFEIGHQMMYANGAPTEIEDLVSGSAIQLLEGIPAKNIRDQRVWAHYTEIFAYSLYNTILHWSPDTVVLGGSLFKDGGLSIEILKTKLAQINTVYDKLPKLVHAELGDFGGLYGGLVYASRKM